MELGANHLFLAAVKHREDTSHEAVVRRTRWKAFAWIRAIGASAALIDERPQYCAAIDRAFGQFVHLTTRFSQKNFK
jgi:hypothetical protein